MDHLQQQQQLGSCTAPPSWVPNSVTMPKITSNGGGQAAAPPAAGHAIYNRMIEPPPVNVQPDSSSGLLMKVVYPPSLPTPSVVCSSTASGAPQGPLPPPPPSASQDEDTDTMLEVSPRPASAGAAAYLALEAGHYGGIRGPVRHDMHGLGGPGIMKCPPRTTRHRGINLRKQHSVSCAQECCDQTRPDLIGW